MNPGKNNAICWVVAGALAAIIGLAYAPVAHHGFINFDDPEYVTENPMVKAGLTVTSLSWAFTTGHAANWHPITWVSHQLDVTLFGLNPAGHHLTNLLFHILNSILLWVWLRRLTGALWRSALVAGLFALHPLHVESVAWIAERKDVLSTFFGLLSLLAYCGYAQSPAESPGRKVRYAGAMLFLTLGLMSKPMLVTWPGVMLLLDFWPLGRGGMGKIETVKAESSDQQPARGALEGNAEKLNVESSDQKSANLGQRAGMDGGGDWRALLWEKLPFAAIVLASCWITFSVQQQGVAVTTAENLPISDRLANAVASYTKYLTKTVWPTDLAIFYPHPETRYPISDQWPLWILALCGLGLLGVCGWVLRARHKRPYLLVGWFWYLGTLVPVIGIVQVGAQGLADRYTYVPLIGVFVAAVWLLADELACFRWGKRLAAVSGTVLLAACFLSTRNQLQYWKDSFSIFSHAVAVTQFNAPAHSNLGTELLERGQYEAAIAHFNAALAADPHFADASYSLGLAAQRQGQLESAVAHYRATLNIRPTHLQAQHNLAIVLWLLNRRAEAEAEFNQTFALRPDYFEAHFNFGTLLLEAGRIAEAQSQLTTAQALRPEHSGAALGLAAAFRLSGQYTEAEPLLKTVLTGAPDNLDATLNLALLLAGTGRTNEATPIFASIGQRDPRLSEQLIRVGDQLVTQEKLVLAQDRYAAAVYLSPTNAKYQSKLAVVLARRGNLAEAREHYERAVELQPTASDHYFLGMICALQTDIAGAQRHFRSALQIDPDHTATLNELAWMLATCPSAQFRNGLEAVQLAERACTITSRTEPSYLGTLAAAYAETGDFPRAIQTAESAWELAKKNGLTELADRNAELLKLYQAAKPYRDEKKIPAPIPQS